MRLLVTTQPRITDTEIGSQLGITERPVRRIISELETAGYLRRSRDSRANRYEANPILLLPGPIMRDISAGDLLGVWHVRSTDDAEDQSLGLATEVYPSRLA